jgi:MoxR-like ATPase
MADLGFTTHADPSVLDYIARLVEETRMAAETRVGVSVRGALAMTKCARIWAAAHGREYVLPDDIKELALPVWTHRLVLDPEAEFTGATAEGIVKRALSDVAAPQERLAGA